MHIYEQENLKFLIKLRPDSWSEAWWEQMSACSQCRALDYHRVRNICDSGTSVAVNPLLIILNGRHLKINVHHFMWTTGGCHDNQACFCVTGGQLSLCQREGGRDEEKRVKEGWSERWKRRRQEGEMWWNKEQEGRERKTKQDVRRTNPTAGSPGLNSVIHCVLTSLNWLLNVHTTLSSNHLFIHTVTCIHTWALPSVTTAQPHPSTTSWCSVCTGHRLRIQSADPLVTSQFF